MPGTLTERLAEARAKREGITLPGMAPRVALNARIPADLRERLDARAVADGMKVTDVVEAALEAYLAVTPAERARHLRDEFARLVADLEAE